MRRRIVLSLAIMLIWDWGSLVSSHHDYKDALAKAIVFFEAQRSGRLPSDQSIKWRLDSGLSDGSTVNVDLSGGYYDAGDNVKFGLPMAFTTTMLSWSVLEFGRRMGNELDQAHKAIRWGTDYLLKATSALPNALYVQVGDPVADHQCWQRAEDTDTPRTVYNVSPANPGSDVAGETAAALAAASKVFKKVDPDYSKTLLDAAGKAFDFADRYRGAYSDHLSEAVCPFYCSYSGYLDELLWGAAWMFKATHNSSYLDYAQALGANAPCDTFSWDNKLAGARVLLSKGSHVKNDEPLAEFRSQAENFMCSVLPGSPMLKIEYTPGGLLHKMNASNMQYVTSTTFLLSTYAKYMKHLDRTFTCGSLVVTPALLREVAKSQVDYVLGDNPRGMSYMVGYGDKFPQHIHHRGSSLPSITINTQRIGCDAGFQSLKDSNPNPNLLLGAIVGGPDKFDSFTDDRNNYAQTEPTTYINAPLVGPLAYLASSFN
ncbi:hypothetical protein AMTRI_Chr11g158360 [Amborella trichopoda]|uniref:Endoglucanase n=1 Tax=Amborella trichopoda TaxID=13333 RepID=W1NWQ4_AMBTC|nr:endoglucanase 3 [Amborella trichopoda]ERM99695.1 hypothetical protein AMTR_s00099p00070580 [Amborella trichopoda]|eukprot:XP_006836842.1 endoglucanase 3 [Amborella trichopoda]